MKASVTSCLRCGLALASAALLFAGCSVPFEFEQVIIEDAVLPSDLANLPTGVPTEVREAMENWTGTGEPLLVGKVCSGLSLEDYLEEAERYVPAGLINRVKIRSVRIEYVKLKASKGNFGTFTEVANTLKADGQELVTFSDENPDGFGQEIELTSRSPYDFTQILENTSIQCIEDWVTIKGSLPPSDVTFDVIVKAKVRAWFSIF